MRALAFTPDDTLLASDSAEDTNIKLWNPQTGELIPNPVIKSGSKCDRLKGCRFAGVDLTRADLRRDSVWGYTRLGGANLDGVNVCDGVMDEGLTVEWNCHAGH